MAPLPRPTSSEAQPHNAQQSVTAATSFPCSCLLSTALRRFRSKTPLKMPQLPGTGVLHADIVSAAERCVRELSSALAEHPFLKPVLRLHFNFQRFCQTNCMLPRSQTSLSVHNFAAILPGDSMAGLVVANSLSNFLNLYNTVLIVRLVLTWFPGAPPAIVSPLSTICDPYLNIFRGIIPPLGGALDLSPILAFLVLNAFTSTASALPAELPTCVTSQHSSPASPLARRMPLNATTIQQKWAKRVCCNQSREEIHRAV